MTELAFYWTGVVFMALWVVSSRREDSQYTVSTFSEFITIILWPFFLVVLAICIIWIVLTGKLPWQR